MKNPHNIIYQIDAFTNKAFKGNPAGVMIVDETTSAEWMQNMASEMNLSETAFLITKGSAFEIRFFTPTVEIPLCGHATLASAHLLYELGLKRADEKILFHAKGGTLEISKDTDEIVMNFPAYPIQKIDTLASFESVVGFNPIEMYSSNNDWVIAVAKTAEDIIKANPNFAILAEHGLGHLMITAEGGLYDVDFVVRCFAPNAGINEDPVTGSAQCALVPLWHSKTQKTSFSAIQLSKRTGSLKLRAIGDRVEIKGQAITVFKAHLMI